MLHGIIERLQDIATVAGKELRHSFRDSHVLIYTVFVPLVLYPAGLVSLSEYTLWREGLAETRPVRVAFMANGKENVPELIDVLKATKKVAVTESVDPMRELEEGKLEAVIDGTRAPEKIEVKLNPASDRFLESKMSILTHSFDARAQAMKKAVDAAGSNTPVNKVFQIATTSVGTVGGHKAGLRDMEVTAFSTTLILVAFYGYTMLIITVGAIYPALAAFTEEAEKKTKSTTYMLPIDRSTITIGKFLAVTMLTLLSGAVNFLSMGLVAVYFTWKMEWLKRALALALKQYNLETVVLLLIVFLLSTLLVAAIYSLIAASAKSFKEAQNISSLILMVVTILPMVALFPGWALDMKTAFIPILNMVLAAKSVVTDSVNPLIFCLACLENLLIAAVLLYMSQIIFWGKDPASSSAEQLAPTSISG
ncbi:MAG: ABC transporter permease subunit [Candidatus Melainabacteria bacterium]|nr:ABC transporter permease subunit [Candidatus Melainabacteria bacterium]